MIGLEDNGNDLGLNEEDLKLSLSKYFFVEYFIGILNVIAVRLKANIKLKNLFKGKKGLIAEVFIKKPPEEIITDNKEEIKIGLLGEESSGKSTLVYLYYITL